MQAGLLTQLYRRAAPCCWLCCMLIVSSCGGPGQVLDVAVDRDVDGNVDSADECSVSEDKEVSQPQVCSLFAGPIAKLDFTPNGHHLNSASRQVLSKLVDRLNQHPTVVIALGGHTDNRGSAADNLQLSKRRVMSVVRFLVANGVSADRLKPYGYGESRPLLSNNLAANRAQNRRIELSVVSR